MAHELRTDIEIDAPPERVWAILMDFDAYPDWNPFIRGIEGDARRDGKLKVRIQPSGGRAMTFNPTVLAAEPSKELRWLGHLGISGLFDGEHRLALEALPDGRTRFRQEERFTGLLVPLFRKNLDKDTRRGFAEMNQALKARAEAS
jgi:hypothetical protein